MRRKSQHGRGLEHKKKNVGDMNRGDGFKT
jgi:hypothetical protein